MHKKQFAFIFLLAALSLRLNAAGGLIPDYKIGETATVDIVTPVHLIVIDHERTEKLRQQEAQRVPAIFRFDPDAIQEAEASLRVAFSAGREEFLDALQETYGKRTLNDSAVSYPRFQRLVALFQKQSRAFPLSTNLAELWALGGGEDVLQTNLLASMREMMLHPVRFDAIPPEARVGARYVKMLPFKTNEAQVDLALIEKQATNFFRTNFYTVARARKELQNSFVGDERGIGKFVAGFVKANCAFDADLTRESRKKATDAIWAADEYEPGQLVVKRGDLIDTRNKAVLDQLRERATGVQAKSELAQAQSETQTTIAQLRELAVRAGTTAQIVAEQNRWLVGGIAGASLAFLIVLWRLTRWKRSHSLLPAKVRNDEIAGTVISCPSCTCTIVLPLELSGPIHTPVPVAQPALPDASAVAVAAEHDSGYWKERALAAEGRAEKNGQVLRASLIPHLARWLASKLLRGLALQRTHLLDTQHKAEQELAELEQRLLAVQAPLEDRLKAYEDRIAELEKGLTAKGEENRELIKATIAIAKKKLEVERSKDRSSWN